MRITPWVLIVLAVTSVLSIENSLAKTQILSDAQVKQKVIEESIAAYPGPCACPFNQARNGSTVVSAAHGANRVAMILSAMPVR